jgi:hypothetical protein
LQAHEKLQHVQQEHETALRQQLMATTRLTMLEEAKGEAEAEARKAVEKCTTVATELAALNAVAQEKQRAADAQAAQLQVRQMCCGSRGL